MDPIGLLYLVSKDGNLLTHPCSSMDLQSARSLVHVALVRAKTRRLEGTLCTKLSLKQTDNITVISRTPKAVQGALPTLSN